MALSCTRPCPKTNPGCQSVKKHNQHPSPIVRPVGQKSPGEPSRPADQEIPTPNPLVKCAIALMHHS
eukprot:10992910-Karenia_brevis.AAC.1